MLVRASDLLLQPLPSLTGSERGRYYPVSSSGKSTTQAATPKVITHFPPSTFQRCLTSPALRAVLAKLGPIEEISVERGHNLIHEGDIERASALYLLHPINVILGNGLLPSLNIPATGFKCIGQYTMDLSRPDILYTINDIPVLILEYKRT